MGKKLIGGGLLLLAVAGLGQLGGDPVDPTVAPSTDAPSIVASVVGATPDPTRTAVAPVAAGTSATPSTTRPSANPLGPLVAVVGVTDGDTIKVRVGRTTERIRLIGIDAPELNPRECFAQQAASRMQSLVQSTSVRLTADPSQADRDRYGRLLRHVWLADGRSVAQLLIAGGYGVEYTYAKPYAGVAAFRSAQASAKAAHVGIWSSGCVKPPVVAKPPVVTQPKSACNIKGNISSSGEKIYHLPGDRYYDVTKITESKGERWFCSESDAVNGGWRHAKV